MRVYERMCFYEKVNIHYGIHKTTNWIVKMLVLSFLPILFSVVRPPSTRFTTFIRWSFIKFPYPFGFLLLVYSCLYLYRMKESTCPCHRQITRGIKVCRQILIRSGFVWFCILMCMYWKRLSKLLLYYRGWDCMELQSQQGILIFDLQDYRGIVVLAIMYIWFLGTPLNPS